VSLIRRDFLKLATGAAAAAGTSAAARAENYPSRPVRFIVGFPPAGTTDIGARLMGQYLSDRLGQQFVVENRPGAGSSVAAEFVAHAPPDGYTILLSSVANAINASYYQNLNFDLVRDFAPVGNVMQMPLVMETNPAFPVKSVAEFITYAKANPGKISMASSGVGTSGHITGVLFAMMSGVDMVHVPYRGAGPALVDVVAGQCQVIFDLLPSSIGYIRSGSLRALGMTTAARSAALPDVPAIGETVNGYDAGAWIGISAPKDTPRPIVGKLNEAINAGLADKTVLARFGELGGIATPGTPEQFGAYIAGETEKWARVIKFANLKAE